MKCMGYMQRNHYILHYFGQALSRVYKFCTHNLTFSLVSPQVFKTADNFQFKFTLLSDSD